MPVVGAPVDVGVLGLPEGFHAGPVLKRRRLKKAHIKSSRQHLMCRQGPKTFRV